MNCACRSVGKPGNGAVVTSTGQIRRRCGGRGCPRWWRSTVGAGLLSASSAACSSSGSAPSSMHVAAGHGRGHGVGAGLDAVGQHAMAWRRSSRATPSISIADWPAPLILRAHLDQQIGEIGDFRLARGILDHVSALGERRGHQRDMGAADRDLRKIDLAAAAGPSAPWRRHSRRRFRSWRRAAPAPSAGDRPAGCRWRSRRAAKPAPRPCAPAAARRPRSSRAFSRRVRKARWCRRFRAPSCERVWPASGSSPWRRPSIE